MTIEDWLGADNALGIDIYNHKYRYQNETFDEWLGRVSGGSEAVRKMILDKRFLFGGRILANRGLAASRKITYSNCYVTDVEDNIESIYETCKKLARTYSYGGGAGLDISALAPRGARINNAANTTTGAVSFMDTFAQVTATIGQNGRRGALMLSISCQHPDVEEFIHVKDDLSRVNAANISVRITDDFMQAVRDDKPWMLEYTRAETGEHITKEISARSLYHSLAKGNWDMGEPGMLFWDRIRNWNLLSHTPGFHYAGVNPCAEEPLPAGGSCLLGSINLAEMVTPDGNFDFDTLADTVYTAVMALNDVLDEGLPLHPLQEQRSSVRRWRQIGLGVMGVADMLIKMGVRYGSQDSIDLCGAIAKEILNFALTASAARAQAFGTYEGYSYEAVSSTPFYKANVRPEVDRAIRTYGLRNSQLLTIAPTGTLSTMLGISGGVEPVFANSYERKTQSIYGEDVYYKIYTPIVKQYMDRNSIDNEEFLPDYFITAPKIPYDERIRVQAAWQQYIDASISSTINMPHTATVEDVEKLYMTAWENGLKGVTVFRDGCRRSGVLIINDDKNDEKSGDNDGKNDEKAVMPKRGEVREASDNLVGKKRKLTTGCGSLHCCAYFDPVTGDLLETYLNKGSQGGCNNFMIGLSRMISLSARAGCSIDTIVDQLNSTAVCPSYAVRKATHGDTSHGSCCPMAVGNALKEMWEEMQNELGKHVSAPAKEKVPEPAAPVKCPKCGAELEHIGGCVQCTSCGWTKCE